MKAWNKFTLYDQNPNVIHKILSTFSNSKASALRNICNKIIDPAAVIKAFIRDCVGEWYLWTVLAFHDQGWLR